MGEITIWEGLQAIVIPLLLVIWKMLDRRIGCLETKVMSKEVCEERHKGLGRELELVIKPLGEKIDRIANGGTLDTLRIAVEKLNGRIGVLEKH